MIGFRILLILSLYFSWTAYERVNTPVSFDMEGCFWIAIWIGNVVTAGIMWEAISGEKK